MPKQLAAVLALGLIVFPVRAQAGKSPLYSLPTEVKNTMIAANELELLSLDPSEDETNKGAFHQNGIRGSTKLTNKDAKAKLVGEIEEGIRGTTEDDRGACFRPRHGVRAKANDTTIELLICFECYRIMIYRNGKSVGSLAIRRGPQKFFDELLADGKVSLTDPPELVTIAKAQGKVVRNSEGSITKTKNGFFIVYQEFEKGEGDSDFFPGRLVGMTSKFGDDWKDRRVVVENEKGDINVFSPSLLRLPDNSTLLCFMRYHSFAKATNKYPPASAFAWISRDECKTFQPLATLWKEKPTTLCSATLRRLKSGRLVIPVNRDLSKKGEADHWEAGSFYSDDNGKTWTESVNYVDMPKRGAMEPHVEEIADNKLLMVMRTQLGHVYKAESSDSGKTWSKGKSLGIEAPESCPELVKIPDTNDLVLIWNASKYDPKWASHFGKRTPLSAALSKDGGKTWGPPRHIETDPKWAFSNPGLFFFGDKAILNYWACEYQKNGSMSNYPIHLKGAIIDKRWFYGKD